MSFCPHFSIVAQVQALKQTGPFTDDRENISLLVNSLSRADAITFPDIIEAAELYDLERDKVSQYILFGKISQYLARCFSSLERYLSLIPGNDDSPPLLRLEYPNFTGASPLSDYTGPADLWEVISETQLFLREILCKAWEMDIKQNTVMGDLAQDLSGAMAEVIGGMNEGAMHMGACAAAVADEHLSKFGTMIEPDELVQNLKLSQMFLKRISELHLYEVKVLDSLLTTGLNPYRAQFLDPSSTTATFNIKDEYMAFTQEVIPLLHGAHEIGVSTEKIGFLLASALADEDPYLGMVTEASAKIADFIVRSNGVEQSVAEGDLHPSHLKTLGCPAMRAKIFDDWCGFLAKYVSAYYRSEYQRQCALESDTTQNRLGFG